MRVSTQAFIALFFWFVYPGIAAAATPPGQGVPRLEGPPALAPHTGRHITLDVVVTDHAGKPVRGLQQQDFTILDNKKPQTILSFREAGGTDKAADPPSQAIVLLDAINNTDQNVAFQREQLQSFLRRGGGELPLPMSLVTFPDKSKDQPLVTQDGNALADSLNSNQPGVRSFSRSQGFYGAMDRYPISLRTLEQLVAYEAPQPGRKLLIWLGVGWPLLGSSDTDIPAKYRAALFGEAVWLSTKLREGRITLYNVVPTESLGGAFYYTQFLKGVGSAQNVQPGDLGLQVLAVQSGGQVLNLSNDMGDSLARCLADARAYYTLSFDTPAAGHADEYHSLQVKIDKPRLTVRTRTGYYAQP
jgi:VWFA-related protein